VRSSEAPASDRGSRSKARGSPVSSAVLSVPYQRPSEGLTGPLATRHLRLMEASAVVASILVVPVTPRFGYGLSSGLRTVSADV
jgi:hypothetical protein